MSVKEFYVPISLNKQEIKNFKVEVLSTQPQGSDLYEGRVWFYNNQLNIYINGAIKTLATGDSLEDAVTQAVAATEAGVLMLSGGANRTIAQYSGSAGIVKVNSTGKVSIAQPGTDYLTADSTNTLTNKTFDANATGNSISNLEVADFAASAVTTDISQSATNSQFATALAIKNYCSGLIASLGKLVGAHDAGEGDLPSTGSGPNGAIVAGDYWRISIGGTITGLGELEPGDVIVAAVDGADEASEFFALQANLVNAVTSVSTSVDNKSVPRFDGTSGKIIKGSSVIIEDNGSIDIPAGQTYNVGGSPHNHTFDNLTDVKNAGITLTDVIAKTDVYYAAFTADDWEGSQAPYTIEIPAATHKLSESRAILGQVKNASGEDVVVGVSVSSSGLVTLKTQIKFAGSVTLVG